MKSRFLLTLLAISFGTFLKAQVEVDVPMVQNSLVTKVTATWCPHCGNWGWTFFEDVIAENEGKAIFLGAHYSGALQSETAKSLTTNFNASGQPQFFINNNNVGLNSNNGSSKLETTKEMIDANYASTPNMGVGARIIKVSDSEWMLHTKVEAFASASGDFYVSEIIVENGIQQAQSGAAGSSAVHPNVVRMDLNGPFGAAPIMENPMSGGTALFETPISVNPNWAVENIRVVVILWEKVGATYQFVNAVEVSEVEEINSVNEFAATDVNLTIAPTIITDQATIQLDVKDGFEDATVALFDLNGRQVELIHQGAIASGTQTFSVEKGTKNGLYLVRLFANNKIATSKVVFQ